MRRAGLRLMFMAEWIGVNPSEGDEYETCVDDRADGLRVGLGLASHGGAGGLLQGSEGRLSQ
jgi:hypothetical protein